MKIRRAPLPLESSPGRVVSHHDVALGPAARIAHVAEWPTGRPDSPVVVVWSGLGGAWFDWTSVAELLPDVRVVVIDQPGNGDSPDWSPGTDTVRLAAADAAVILARLGIGHAVLVGHSMGGWYAEAAGRMHPDEVGGVMLLDASLATVRHRPPTRCAHLTRHALAGAAWVLLAAAAGLVGWHRLGPALRELLEGPGPAPAQRPAHRQACRRT